MNYGALNSYGCDAVPISGDNTILKDTVGLGSSAGVLAAIVASSMLNLGVASASMVNTEVAGYTYTFTGGINSDTNAYGMVAGLVTGGIDQSTSTVDGNVGIRQGGGVWSENTVDAGNLTFSMMGGMHSAQLMNAKWFLPLTLYSGITSLPDLGGDLYWRAGMYGGIDNSSDFESTPYRIDLVMNNGIVSYPTFNAYLVSIPVINGGISSSDVIDASVDGDVRLQSVDKLYSTNDLDSFMSSGRNLYDGNTSEAYLYSQYQVDTILTGSILNTHDLVGSLKEHIMLQGSIVSVGVPNAGYIIHAELDYGIGSNAFNMSELIAASVLNEGIASTPSLNSKQSMWATLSNGVVSLDLLESAGIKANVNLSGGLECLDVLTSKQTIDAVRTGGWSNSAKLISNYKLSPTLNLGEVSSNLLHGSYIINAKLLGSVNSVHRLESNLQTYNKLNGYCSSTEKLYSQLLVSQRLLGDLLSSSSIAEAEITSYFGDMLHNNDALAITSATIPLNITVPLGDT